MKKLIPWIIIVILATLLFLQRSCSNPCPPTSKPDTITIVKYDSIMDTVLIPKPYYINTILPPDTFIKWDSAGHFELLKQYYSKNIYYTVLKNDADAFVSVLDTIHMNQLQQRKLYFINRRPTVVQNVTTVIGDTLKKRNKVWVGMNIGNKIDSFDFGPSLLLVTKKDAAYTISYGVMTKNIYGTVFFKISLKRK